MALGLVQTQRHEVARRWRSFIHRRLDCTLFVCRQRWRKHFQYCSVQQQHKGEVEWRAAVAMVQEKSQQAAGQRRTEPTCGGRLWGREQREAAERRKMQVHLQREGKSKQDNYIPKRRQQQALGKEQTGEMEGPCLEKIGLVVTKKRDGL